MHVLYLSKFSDDSHDTKLSGILFGRSCSASNADSGQKISVELVEFFLKTLSFSKYTTKLLDILKHPFSFKHENRQLFFSVCFGKIFFEEKPAHRFFEIFYNFSTKLKIIESVN